MREFVIGIFCTVILPLAAFFVAYKFFHKDFDN